MDHDSLQEQKKQYIEGIEQRYNVTKEEVQQWIHEGRYFKNLFERLRLSGERLPQTFKGVINGLSVDDLPIERGTVNSSNSWVTNYTSSSQLLLELKNRPQGRFPEVEDFHFRGKDYCRCKKCCDRRRELAKDLENISCWDKD